MTNGPDPNRFVWWKVIPVWASGLGTVGLAYIAFVTLTPIIENLEIRDQNRVLRDNNKELQNVLLDANRAVKIANSDLAILTSRIDDARKDAETFREERSELFLSLTKITANIEKQVQRERLLTDRLGILEAEAQRLSRANDGFRAENERLKRNRQQAEIARDAAEAKREEIKRVFISVLQLNRQFILNDIVTKLKAYTPPELSSLKEAFGLVSPEIHTYPRAVGFWYAVRPRVGIFSETTLTGHGMIVELFKSEIFKLLPELQRVAFQDEIRTYMKQEKNADVFNATVLLDLSIFKELIENRRKVRRTIGSKYFQEPSSEDIIVEEVTPEEVKRREQIYEAAKSRSDKHKIQFYAARPVLHAALDRMMEELVTIREGKN